MTNLLSERKHYDEMHVSTVLFDAVALRNAMSPKNREIRELGEIIDEHVIVKAVPAKKKEHFLEISMSGINSNGDIFLDMTAVRTYLEQVAPLPFDTQFLSLSKKFYDWVKQTGVMPPEVHITFNDNSYELFKSFRQLTYSTAQGKYKVEVRGLRFFPENVTNDSPFWGWYAETNCPGIIGDDSVAGFRLRKANIAIGLSERMTDIFRLASESYARFNRYFIGEVHIQDHAVIPNAHRDDFEETPEWLEIRKQLVEFARVRSREAYALSEGRNADIEKLITGADRQLEEVGIKQHTGLASKVEQAKLDGDIGRYIEKIEMAEKADRSEEDRGRLGRKREELETARERIANETKFTGQNLKPSLTKGERKIIRTILGLLYDALDEKNYETARTIIQKKYGISEKE